MFCGWPWLASALESALQRATDCQNVYETIMKYRTQPSFPQTQTIAYSLMGPLCRSTLTLPSTLDGQSSHAAVQPLFKSTPHRWPAVQHNTLLLVVDTWYWTAKAIQSRVLTSGCSMWNFRREESGPNNDYESDSWLDCITHCVNTYDQWVLTSWGLCANVLHEYCHTAMALELLYSSFASKTLTAQSEIEKQHMWKTFINFVICMVTWLSCDSCKLQI